MKNLFSKSIKFPLIFFVFLIIFFIHSEKVFAGSCTSTGSTAWTTGSTWTGTCTGTSGIPAAGDTVTIATGHTVTSTSAMAAASLTITGGLSVTGANAALTLTGAIGGAGVITSASSTYTFTINVGGDWNFSGTFGGSRLAVVFNGSGDQTIASTASTLTTLTLTINKASGIMYIAKTPSAPSSSLTLTAGAINYSGGSQNVLTGTYPAALTFSGTGTKTLTGTTTAIGAWTNSSGITIASGNYTMAFQNDWVNNGVALNAGSSPITIGTGTTSNNIAAITTTGLTTFSKTGGTTTLTGSLSTGAFTKNGSGGTFAIGGNTLTMSGTITNTAGTLSASSGTAVYSGTSQTVIPTTYGTLSISGTASISGTVTVSTALSGAGTLTNNNGGVLNIGGTSTISHLDASTTGNTVDYTGSGQTINTTVGTYATLTVDGTATNTGTVTVNTALNGVGTLTNNVVGTLEIKGTCTISNLDASSSAGNIVYYDGTTQTLKVTNYSTLRLSGGAKTLGAITTIGGDLTMSSSATATTGANLTVGGVLTVGTTAQLTVAADYTLGVTGTTSITGTLTLAGVGTKTFTSDVTLNSGGVWNETGIASINFAGSLTNNATTFTANTGTHTFSGTGKTISGSTTTAIPALTISGTTTNNGSLDVSTTLAGASTLTNGATGTLTIGATSVTPTLTATAVGNTVIYDGTSQTLKVTAYHHLTLSAGAKTFGAITTIAGNFGMSGTATATTGANLVVNGTTTIGDGTTLTLGAYSFESDGNMTVGGGTSGAFNAASGTGITLKGNLQISAGSTWTEMTSGNVTFSKGGAQTITDNTTGCSTDASSCQDIGVVVTATSSTSISPATNLEMTSLSIVSSTTLALSSYTLALNGTGTVFSNAGSFTGATSTIKLTNNSSSAKTFAGGGGTYNNFWFAPSSGTGSLTISGDNHFADFKDDGTAGHSLIFTATSTQYFTSFTVSGHDASNRIIITSTTTGIHTLSQPSGTVNSDYLDIQHSVATGGATWNAGSNSLNHNSVNFAGSGWIFPITSCTSQVATGNWNTIGTWDCGVVPTTGIATTIRAGDTITMNVASNVLGYITINGILNTSSSSYALSGATLNITSTGTLTANNSTITLSGTTGTLFTKDPSGTFTDGGSTVVFSGNGTATLNSGAITFNNLTSSGTGTKTLGAAITIDTNLVVSAGTFQLSTYGITVTGTTSITGTLDDSSATGTDLFTGAVTINNGGTWTSTGGSAYEFRGGLTVNSTSTFTSGAGVYTFSTNAQTVAGTQTYTIASLTNNITTSTGLTLSGSTATITTLTQGSNAILTISGTVPTITTLTATATGNTVNYSGTSQTLKVVSYYNLTLSGGAETFGAITTIGGNLTLSGSATATVGAALVVSGNTSIGDGTTLTLGAYTFQSSGTTTIGGGTSGIITCPTSASCLGLKTFSGLVTLNAGAKFDLTTSSTNGTTLFSAGIAQGSSVQMKMGTGNAQLVGNLSGSGTGGIYFGGYLAINSGTTSNGYTGGIVTVGNILTLNGGWTQANGSSLSLASGISGLSTFDPSASTNTVNYYTTTGGQNIKAVTYDTLIISNSSNTDTASGAITVNNSLTTTAGGIFAMSNYQLLGNFTVTNNGTITTATTVNPAIPTGKTWGGTVEYTVLTGAQYVPAGTYTTLTFDNSSNTDTANGDLSITTLNTTSGGTLNMGTNVISAVTTASGSAGTIKTSNTTSTPIPTGKTWGGTIEYGATSGAQTVVTGTYNNLTLDNTSGTDTAGGTLTVNGVLTTTSGGTLAMTTYQLLSISSVTNNGTVTTTCTTNPAIPTGETWTGTTGAVTFAATTGGQYVPAGTYGTLTFSNSSNTDTAAGAITTTNLTTTSGGTLDMATYALTVTTPTNNGTLKTSTTTNPAFTTGKTWAGTVEFAATSGGQYIPAGTYTTLTFDNSSNTDTANGDLSITTLNTTSGGTLNMGTNVISAVTTASGSAGTIKTSNTTSTPIPTGKTWGGTIEYGATSGAQTVVTGTYNNLKVDNTSANDTAAGVLTATTLTTTAGGTLNMATYDLATTNITNGGTIRTQSTSATPLPSGKTWAGTVTYDATTGGQTIVAATSYNNLTLGNSSGTQTLGGAITLASSGTLAISAGTFDAGNNLVTGAGSNTLTVANGATLKIGASTFTGNFSSGFTTKTFSAGSTVDYSSNGAQTILNTTYSNLNTSTGGTKTLIGNTTVSSVMTIGSGSTLALGTSIQLTLSGTNGVPLVINGTLQADTGTVVFSGDNVSGNTTIPATTYYGIMVNNSAETYVLGGNTTASTSGLLNVWDGTFDTSATGNYSLSIGKISIANRATAILNANGSMITLNDISGTGYLFFRNPSGVFNAGASTIVINSDVTANIFSNTQTINNLSLSPTLTNDRTYSISSGNTITLTGNLLINPSGSANRLTVNTVGVINVDATKTTTVQGSGSASSTLSMATNALSTGFLDIESGGTLSATSGALTLTGTTGTLMTRAGTGVYTAGTSLVTISGAGSNTINSGTFTGTNKIYSMTINASGYTKTLGGDFELDPAGTLMVTAGTFDTSASGNYALTVGKISVATSQTFNANNSTITLNATSGTLFTKNGTFNAGGSTVNLSGNGDTTINSGSPTFYNLTSSGTGTKILSALILFASGGTLNVSAGTFDPSTYLITGSGSNTLTVANGATLRVGASTFAGNYNSGFTTKTFASGSTVDYFSNGTQTIDNTLSYSNLSTSTGGTKILGGDTTATGAVTINTGSTLDTTTANHYTLNAGSITMNGGTFTPKASTINLTGTGTIFNYTSGNITPATSTLKITDTSSNNKTFAGGGQTFNNLLLTGAGTGDYTIAGSNTFNDFAIDTPPHTVNFTTGTTTTATSFTVSGTAGNLNTLQSSIAGAPWTIVGSGTNVLNYISVGDSMVSGSGTFQALNSQDLGRNYGWILGTQLYGGGGVKARGGSAIESSGTPDAGQDGGGTSGGSNVVLPQCSDSIDNDSDTLIDANDPNCHLDGDLQKAYVPTWDSETTSPVSNTGGGQGGGGGDLGYLFDKIRFIINPILYFPKSFFASL